MIDERNEEPVASAADAHEAPIELEAANVPAELEAVDARAELDPVAEPAAVVAAPEPVEAIVPAEPTMVMAPAEPTMVMAPAEPTMVMAAAEPAELPSIVSPDAVAAAVLAAQLKPEPPATAIFPEAAIFRPTPQTPAAKSVDTPVEFGLTPAGIAQSDEAAKLAAERAARREAREQALAGAVVPPPVPLAPVKPPKAVTDRFFGSLGLFLLRLTVAVILTIRGLNIVMNIPAAQEFFRKTIIPQPGTVAVVTGVAELAIALALLFGLAVRLAGLGVATVGIGALVFVVWGPWSIFIPGQWGFIGELELLLSVVGLALVFLGGGGWSLDRGLRASRERDREQRIAEGL